MDLLRKLIRRPSDAVEAPTREIKRMRIASPGAETSSSNGWGEDEQNEAKASAGDREKRNRGNPFLNLPESFLEGVFLELDLGDLAQCKRICRACHRMLKDSAPLVLHFELLAASLSAPQTSRTTTTSRALLTTLLERRKRLANFDPSSSFKVKLEQDEGRLYEYLEGYLLRGNGLSTSPVLVNPMLQFEGDEDPEQDLMDQIINNLQRMPHGATVYDLGEGAEEWEDEETPTRTLQDMIASSSSGQALAQGGLTVEEAAEQDEMIIAVEDDDPDMYSKRKWSSSFEVKDVAMDPGQDLFVAAEMSREPGDRPWKLHLHMLSLTDFKPHPACQLREGKLESLTAQSTRGASLVIQICDDKVFVFVSRRANALPDAAVHPAGSPPETTLMAFEWTTGQLLFEILREPPVDRHSGFTIMEDFILLSDKTFGVVTYSAEANPTRIPVPVVTAFDIHTLVPKSEWMEVDAVMEGQDPTPEQAANLRRPRCDVHVVARLILPDMRNLVNITSRADPPPRAFFPNVKPLAVYPSPNTGIIVLSFDTHDFDPIPGNPPTVYTLFIRKETIYDHVPYLDFETGGLMSGLTDSLLASLPQVVPFAQLAPHCRLMDDIEPQDWVCHTYHYRFICGLDQPSTFSQNRIRDSKRLRILNFDPIEVRRVICERRNRIAKDRNIEPSQVADGDLERYDHDGRGIQLHLAAKSVGGGRTEMLTRKLQTGEHMPYISVWDSQVRVAQGMMLDDSRIVLISERQANGGAAGLEVLNF